MASLKRQKEGDQPKPKRAKPTPWELIKKEELMELEKQFSNLPYKEKWEYIQCRLFPDNSRTPAACNAMWSMLKSTQEDKVESNREERAKLSAAAGGRNRKSPTRFENQTFPGSYDTASTSDDDYGELGGWPVAKECPECVPGSGKAVRHTGRHVTVVKEAGAGAGAGTGAPVCSRYVGEQQASDNNDSSKKKCKICTGKQVKKQFRTAFGGKWSKFPVFGGETRWVPCTCVREEIRSLRKRVAEVVEDAAMAEDEATKFAKELCEVKTERDELKKNQEALREAYTLSGNLRKALKPFK